jgi:hypothetical protein
MIVGSLALMMINLLLAILITAGAPPYTYIIMFGMYLPVFNMTLGPVCWVYFSETLTDLGMGLAMAFDWITMALLSIIMFAIDSKTGRSDVIFWI